MDSPEARASSRGLNGSKNTPQFPMGPNIPRGFCVATLGCSTRPLTWADRNPKEARGSPLMLKIAQPNLQAEYFFGLLRYRNGPPYPTPYIARLEAAEATGSSRQLKIPPVGPKNQIFHVSSSLQLSVVVPDALT